MKRKLTAAFFLLTASMLFAQSNLEPFSKIDLRSVGKVFLKQGDSLSVTVNTAGKKEDIRTHVKNNTLVIDSRTDAEYYVTMKAIDEFTVSGSGEINGDNAINSDFLQLNVSGNGKMILLLNVKKLETDISGVGKLTLSGTADEAGIAISGSGKVEGYELKVRSCNADISGIGKCTIDVSDALTTNISGMGSVNYKTKPATVHENVSGIGKINDRTIMPGSKSSGHDTTSLKLGNYDVFFVTRDSSKVRRKHKGTTPIWSGLELGFNTYLNESGGTSLAPGNNYLELNSGKSVSVALNLLQKNFEFGHSNFWFFTGLGITWNNYRFDNNVVLNSTGNYLTGARDTSSSLAYKKSKLVVSYLTAPLMFEVFTNKTRKNAFHIGAGAMLGYRIGSHTKLKVEEDNNTSKHKDRDSFFLNDFRYGGRAAIGFNKFNVFADYYPSALFKDSKGPVLYPFDFGITLVGF